MKKRAFVKKTVLITGAASGIGRSTAEEFARAGATVILTDRDEEALQKTADALSAGGADVHCRVVDVTDQAAVEALASWVIATFGALDVLVNNAGVGHQGELADTSLETWRRLMDVNFWGPIYHVHAFLPSMLERRSGHIVNVSSGQAFFRLPTWGAYASIKVALGAYSEILRFELRRHGIRVTTVYPFMVNTPFYKDVKGKSLGSRLSMSLLPYYSMTPERVGRILFEAIGRRTPVELVSPINRLGMLMHLVPPLADAVSWLSDLVLSKDSARAA